MNRRDVLIGAAGLAACAREANGLAQAPGFPIRRGVNMGNALEAVYEGEWGYEIEERHLAAIAQAGFDGIRLPVRWDEHAEGRPGYRIDPRLFERVDEVIAQAFGHGLKVQLDVHHFWRLQNDPERYAPFLPRLWAQIAPHYADYSQDLIFEVVNELHDTYWSGARYNALIEETIGVMRESNPTRTIVVGPPDWNSINGLKGWTLPRDNNIVLTVHYYGPRAFTDQLAEWQDDPPPAFGRDWGTPDDIAEVQSHLALAAEWAAANNIPLQLGEFGVNRAVRVDQRALWTRTMREACESHAMAWCVWDFAGMFPIYDLENEAFFPGILDALFG